MRACVPIDTSDVSWNHERNITNTSMAGADKICPSPRDEHVRIAERSEFVSLRTLIKA